jgi:hypothetical protein
MQMTDKVLLEAAALARNFQSPEFRKTAARELAAIDLDVGREDQARGYFLFAVRSAALGLAAMNSDDARPAAADALMSLVRVARLNQPQSPGRRVESERSPYWVDR